jgi:hypothetical protein
MTDGFITLLLGRDLEFAHQIFCSINNIRGDAATLQLLGNLKGQLMDYPGAGMHLEEVRVDPSGACTCD